MAAVNKSVTGIYYFKPVYYYVKTGLTKLSS